MKPQVKKYLLAALGSLALALGFIGIAIPVLPTTPFLLIAVWCYLHSSQKLSDWLLRNRLFGRYLYQYTTFHAVPRRTKIVSLIVLWAGLILSIFLVELWFVRLILLAVGITVSCHILLLKTIRPDEVIGPEVDQPDSPPEKRSK